MLVIPANVAQVQDTLRTVIPANAGIQRLWLLTQETLGTRVRRNDARHKSGLMRTVGLYLLLSFALLLASTTTFAQATRNPAPLQFTNAAEEARFHDLVAELRCVMCQNQSLADSNALIAQDLRREVLGLIKQGNTDAEVKQYLVARYGEFVLYRPQVKSSTWLLWFGPLLLLVAGGIVVARVVRQRSGQRPVAPDDTQEW